MHSTTWAAKNSTRPFALIVGDAVVEIFEVFRGAAEVRSTATASRSALLIVTQVQHRRVHTTGPAMDALLRAALTLSASADTFQRPLLPLFSAADSVRGVTEYRIPLLLAIPPANSTLLAFAEARLPCQQSCGDAPFWGDSSPKHIAMRRSTDSGQTWGGISFVHRSNGTNDNLNLGSVVYDSSARTVLLHWGGCVHCSCTGTVPKPAPGHCAHPELANVQQLRSTDEGASWGEPRDIS